MDRHKILYKENSALQSPRQHSRLNRALQGANRKAKRGDLRMVGRNVTTSPCTPSPRRLLSSPRLTPICAGSSPQNLLLGPEICSDKENAPRETAGEPKEQANALVVQSVAEDFQRAPLRIVKAACAEGNPKLTRQEAYLKRFIEWKQLRQQEAAAKKRQSKQQFKPAGAIVKPPALVKGKVQSSSRSFAPKNHSFKAPAGLKLTEEMKQAFSNTVAVKQALRTSLYTVVPTPPRNKKDTSIAKKAFLGSHSGSWAVKDNAAVTAPPLTHKTAAQITMMSSTSTPNVGSKSALNGLHNAAAAITHFKHQTRLRTPSGVLKTAPQKSAFKLETETKSLPTAVVAKPFLNQKPLTKTPSATQNTNLNSDTAKVANASNDIKNQMAKKQTSGKMFLKPAIPPPLAPRMALPRAVKPLRESIKPKFNGALVKEAARTGAVVKARELQQKRLDEVKKNAKLAMTLKAKKTGAAAVSTNKNTFKAAAKRTHPIIQLSKQRVHGMLAQELPLAETPNCLSSTNTFDAFVTSTKHKNPPTTQAAEEFSELAKTISPVEIVITDSSSAVSSKRNSAKRALLLGKQQAGNFKFNFIQDESANLSVVQPAVPVIQEKQFEEAAAAELKKEVATDINAAVVVEKANPVALNTPVRDSAEERPMNYLSPYVSVSRGKVSLNSERKKRDSVYLNTPPTSAKRQKDGEAQTPVEVRRTLETVRYFRLQVSNEITRLRALCNTWEIYKNVNISNLEETGGVDMINMTIGQTNLLINKKFKQFTGLIERCEADAKGQGPECDGGEDTKPVTAVDLEGFWSMVGLQIDNVSKRFENLDNWKANNWCDPDEIKVKPAKSKKPRADQARNTATSKAKPSSALQQMFRRLHAETRKKKIEGNLNKIEALATTPPRQLRPRTTPVIVQDRKSRSPVPTIVMVRSSTSRSRSIVERDQRSDLLKVALIGAQQKHRQSFAAPATPYSPERATPITLSRKSILKTPGTSKRQTKSVIFNETPQVKQFNFVFDAEEDQSDEKNANTEGTPSMYRLRNRNIKLRPEEEIKIPHK